MTTKTPAAGLEAGGARTVTLGDRDVVIERPKGLKASRALGIMKTISRAGPDLLDELAKFRRHYEATNVLELDRVQARMKFPPRPLIEDGVLVRDEQGAIVYLDSPIDLLTEDDWAATGGIYAMPASPSVQEIVTALADTALTLAEDAVYRLLALFTIPNDDLAQARSDGTDAALIQEAADRLLDEAYADEILELFVVVAETVDHHFRRKANLLGPRLGNALAAFGLKGLIQTASSPSATTSASSRPSSSTASPPSTGGRRRSPSANPSTSSSSSADSSNATTNGATPPSKTGP